MKVLHLTTHINTGGISTYILKLAKPLRAEGVEIQVLSNGGELSHQFQEQGVMTHELPIRTKSELHPKIYFAIPKVIDLIRREKIDLIHAHTRITQIMALCIQKLTGLPYVTTCHGFYKRRFGRRLIPAWGNRAIAISQPVADQLKGNFQVPIARIRMVNNAVDLEHIDSLCHAYEGKELKSDFGFNSSDPVIGVVARLVKDKGHAYLIQAVAELKTEFPNIKLLIVGDGNYRQTLEKLVDAHSLRPHVVFMGNLSDVIKPLMAMDVFVLPATWREGFGLSIVEAMACRKPVIVTNIWSLNSLIQNRLTGILIEPKQIPPLTEAIRKFLKDSELRREIGAEGRKMVERLFCIDRMAQEIATVYREVLQKSHTSRNTA